MNENKSKDEQECSGDVQRKSRFYEVFFSHSTEIISAVIVGVVVTVLTASFSDYFLHDNEFVDDAGNHAELSFAADTQTMRHYFIRANLANIIANITAVKMIITEYYMFNGSLPKTREDLDLSIYDLEEVKGVDSIFLSEKGGITVDLSADFGSEKSLELNPAPSKNGFRLKWSCRTNLEERYLGVKNNRICEPYLR